MNKHSNQPADQMPEAKVLWVVKKDETVPEWIGPSKIVQETDEAPWTLQVSLPHGIDNAHEGDTILRGSDGELILQKKAEKPAK